MQKTAENIFVSHLKARGLKFTSERRIILEAVFSMHNHFEVDDLHVKIRGQSDNNVSKATIYRTLPLIVEAGLLREVVFVEKHAHFEHTFGHKHHEHLICLECGKIIEFIDSRLEDLLVKAAKDHQFEAQGHKIEVTGVCEDCRKR